MLMLAAVPCASCHAKQAAAHERTHMRHTLMAPARSSVLNTPRLGALGKYRYTVSGENYRVTDGERTLDLPIRWAVGQGEAGQTFILERAGLLYESRVSYYAATEALGPTIGAPPDDPKSLDEAAGRELTPRAVFECFGCHSAPPATPGPGVARGSLAWTQTLKPGVQCESCHANAVLHAESPTLKPPKLAGLGAEEISDVCGKCHRTWADIATNGPRGVATVRFQPYRIARSKCYDETDARIACTACHDPHDRPSRDAARVASDRACTACHASSAGRSGKKLCSTGAAKDCASCHMPKYEIPGSRFRFADHWIRVARKNDAYPD